MERESIAMKVRHTHTLRVGRKSMRACIVPINDHYAFYCMEPIQNSYIFSYSTNRKRATLMLPTRLHTSDSDLTF